jgi:hypothetical protein
VTKNKASARDGRVNEFKRAHAEAEQRWTEMVAKGHESRLPPPDVMGAALDEVRFTEIALQVLEALPKTGRPPGAQDQRRPRYRAIAAECLKETGENYSAAQTLFVERTVVPFNIEPTTAKKRFSEAYVDITRPA